MSSGRKGMKRVAEMDTPATQPSKKSRKEPIPKNDHAKQSERKSGTCSLFNCKKPYQHILLSSFKSPLVHGYKNTSLCVK